MLPHYLQSLKADIATVFQDYVHRNSHQYEAYQYYSPFLNHMMYHPLKAKNLTIHPHLNRYIPLFTSVSAIP